LWGAVDVDELRMIRIVQDPVQYFNSLNCRLSIALYVWQFATWCTDFAVDRIWCTVLPARKSFMMIIFSTNKSFQQRPNEKIYRGWVDYAPSVNQLFGGAE